MSKERLHYEQLIEAALRDVVRRALAVVAEDGLPGDHHFHITFRTDHPGVEIPADLRAQYPEEMTIVLQHMFWDLNVDADRFAVTLAFNSLHRRLVVPLEAVLIFQDQSVGFVLQFQDREDGGEARDDEAGESRKTSRSANSGPAQERPGSQETAEAGDADDNVVRIETFRKK